MFTIPMFNILMSGKSEAEYRFVFGLLHAECPMFDPGFFTGDFERAMWRMFAEIFCARFGGCIFHLFQNISRHMRDKKVPLKYRRVVRWLLIEVAMASSELCFDGCVAKLSSLLSCGCIIAGYPPLSGCAAFGRYFFVSYIGVNGKMAKVASPLVWAAYARPLVLDDAALQGVVVDLTNNVAESANAKYADFMAHMCAKTLQPLPFMVQLNSGVMLMFSIPAAYATAVDSSGMLRVPREHYMGRVSQTSMTHLACACV
jgi:hypothetical protein